MQLVRKGREPQRPGGALARAAVSYGRGAAPVSKPLKRESKAKAGERVQRARAAKGKG